MTRLAETTGVIDPTAEQPAETATRTAETARRFNLEPRIAMISFSNFGSTKHPHAEKVAEAVAMVKRLRPELIIEGEMQADAAVEPHIASPAYPLSKIQGDATVQIIPKLDSATAANKPLFRLG